MNQEGFDTRLQSILRAIGDIHEKNGPINSLERLMKRMTWENRYVSGNDVSHFLADSFDGEAWLRDAVADFLHSCMKK